MKRILTLSFAVLCLLLSAVLLASCGPTKGPSEHEHVWDEGKVIKEGTCDPATKAETKGEKLYTCTICGETKTEETDGHVWDDGQPLSQPTCSAEGQTIYFCTRCRKGKTEPIPKSDAHVYRAGDKGRIVTPPTADKPGELEKVCTACGKGIVVDEVTIGDYNRQVRTLRNEINQFTNADFNANSVVRTRQEMISLSGRTFNMPPTTPTAQHPRVLFNASNREAIAAELYDSRSKAAQLEFLKYVNNPTTGKLSPAGTRDDGFHNFDADVLNRIQALALDYQLTGNEISGYSAVRAMLNYLKTMDFQTITGDYERQNGFVMYTAACVYDWCHDLMNDADRQRMVAGVQHKCCEGKTNPQGTDRMEIGFPPSGQHSIAGHGCEYQLLRDYLSFAIAIYDEYPGWWEYIAGRIYQEFVPTRNEYYKAGMYPQGVSVYIRIRFTSDLFSAWLLKAATGRMPYDEEGMKQVARTYYCYELPDKEGFASGDNGAPVDDFIVGGRATMISSYLFNDATMRAQLEYFGQSYSSFTTAFTFSASVTEYLICSSGGTKAASDRHEDLPLIQYNGGWLGQIIARNSWNADQATVLMKIGERTMANHDHADAGSFQIYYKTTLAGDTGSYDTYDAAGNKFPHFKYYHQATIAHNSLLIFNPSKAGSSTNDEKYYSGGQKQPGETGNTTTVLQTDAFKTGTVTGRAWGYADAAQKTPTYAYIAGDITPAYYEKGGSSSNTVNEVARRMLTVYDTGNADVPMFFFVFDNIAAKSGSYKKTFLLHVRAYPTISDKVVTVKSDGAQLVLQNVFGGDSIVAHGGYMVNNNQTGEYEILSAENDGFWGRVEISPATGNPTDQLLNVMYVCDANKTPTNVTATGFSNDKVKGAVIGNTAAVFVTSATTVAKRASSTFSFKAADSGTLTYYVSGVKAGAWTVTAGGQTQTVTATEDGGLLVFTAPAGTVTLALAN